MAGSFKRLEDISLADISSSGLSLDDSNRIYDHIKRVLKETEGGRVDTWRRISTEILRPELPFDLHKLVFFGCYEGFGSDTPPAWIPDRDAALSTNIGRLLQVHGKRFMGSAYKDPISSFLEFQKFSASNPEGYWSTMLDEMGISFSLRPSCILKENNAHPGGQWLPGAILNAAENCLSFNCRRKEDDVAIIWRDEGFDSMPLNHMTIKELRSEVSMVVAALETLGMPKGTAIGIDMPMNATSVVIYLAIVSAGLVVVSIADSFAPTEIATRIKISDAKGIFTQDYIVRGDKNIPLYSRVVDAGCPPAIVVPTKGSSFSRELRDGDMSWHAFLRMGKDSKYRIRNYTAVDCPVEAFTNILFSSGTTGEPKAIPWTHATPLKAAADAWAHMNICKGDVVAWPTNLGWMMGPWLVYATLINGASMALYNGSPLGHEFAKFVQDARVTMLGVIPSIVRSWKNTNCTAGIDWSSIRCFSSTGEASSVEEYLWLMGRAGYKPVIEYCGGTEIGGAFVTGSLLQPQSLSSFSTPAMGCTLFILDRDGKPLSPNEPGIGEIALLPTMLGASTTLLNGDHYKVYFQGMPVWNGKILRRHGDELERTSSGYYRAHGRADDTMNLGGIKVSSVEIERVCNGADSRVLETAAIGVPPRGGGPDQLVVVVVFRDQEQSESEKTLTRLKSTFNVSLQRKLNPLFRVSSIMAVPSLPRTATNKVMRRLLKQQLQQQRGQNGPKL